MWEKRVKLVMYNTVFILNTLASMAQYSRSRTIWKTLDSNDQNQVADQRFSLKNNGLMGVLSLAGSENLVVIIVI